MIAITRLYQTLLASGIPVDRVTGVPPNPTITYQPWITGAALTAAQSATATVLATFNWTTTADDAWVLSQRRAGAADSLDRADSHGQLLRALVGVLVSEVNTLRQWVSALRTQIGAASSLANLQTRVGGLAALADRTADQARAAVLARVNDGTADS